MRSVFIMQEEKAFTYSVNYRMFILADVEERCILVTVYYIDISTSVSLGDIIEISKPVYRLMNIDWRMEVDLK